MSKSKLKTYYVTAKVLVEVNTAIKAESMEDALEKSREMKELDFVTINGDFSDGELKIIGVFEEYKRIEL